MPSVVGSATTSPVSESVISVPTGMREDNIVRALL